MARPAKRPSPVRLRLPVWAEPGAVGWSETVGGTLVKLAKGMLVRPAPLPLKEPAKVLDALLRVRALE